MKVINVEYPSMALSFGRKRSGIYLLCPSLGFLLDIDIQQPSSRMDRSTHGVGTPTVSLVWGGGPTLRVYLS